MARPPVVSIGNQDFASIRERGNFYVDKTSFIREWWDSDDVVTLITRPRRFGKTLNMSMLTYFFSPKYAGREDLFSGLEIWEEQRFRSLHGQVPVISISLAGVKGTTYEDARKGMVQLIVRMFQQYRYVLSCPGITGVDCELFDAVSLDMDDATLASSLNLLCDLLEKSCNQKPIVLIDEYDTPLEQAYVHGFWQQMVNLTQPFFNNTFKTNPHLLRGLMTGVTRVSKESIFSDLNNLEVVSTTSEKYETSFGFTEEEVKASLASFGLQDRMDDVRLWYDGFRFGKQENMYNPWSITKFLDTGELAPWWANTSQNSLIDKIIREGSPKIKETMEDLLAGGRVDTPLDEELVFKTLDSREEAVWSLLVASGYLKIAGRTGTSAENWTYHLALTNHEVKVTFQNMIAGWFDAPGSSYNGFIEALLLDDLDYMNEYMNDVSHEMFSSFDVGKKPSESARPERFYHGFVLGLIVDLRDRYHITSNRESGLGRYDVMLEPIGPADPAFVLEFKVRRPRTEATLEDTVRAALAQIEAKNYDATLVTHGVSPERIRHYGFAFDGKDVLIG